MNTSSKTRRAAAVLFFLAIAATAWLMLHEGLRSFVVASHDDVVFNPGYQHSERLKVAAARAAMDVLGMQGSSQTTGYQADYHLQRMQIQADSEGLERWAPNDLHHQGLLMEIRASLADLTLALDQATGSAANLPGRAQIPLQVALNRAESALSNYSASLTEPTQLQTTHYLFTPPVLLWWLMVLLLVELAFLAWLVFSRQKAASTSRP